MKSVRYVFVFGLILTFILSACGSPTPVVIVVTATPLPSTETQVVEPTPTLVTVPLSGPQNGATMKWIDGSTLVYISPSEFIMGNGGFDSPTRTVALDGFWMYQTKVTNRMFAQCVAVGACSAPFEERGSVYTNPEYANHPVVGVTWNQAQTYCGWSQGQLPTEAQWEKSARGTAGALYPWGSDDPACDLLNLGYCSGRTSEVDAFPGGRSPYGLYDMAGNIFEWVNEWYGESYYSAAPSANPTGPESGEYRSIRGSSFETDFDQVASAIRHFGGAQTYHNRDLGFRCAVTEPKLFAPYCQLSAFIPTGVIVSNGCELPQTEIAGQYCAGGNSFATIYLPVDAIYEADKDLKCEEAVVDGQRILTCLGPKAKEVTNSVTVCNPTCSNSSAVTDPVPTCESGYLLDPATGACNYAPILGQVGVAGCPVGYVLADRGGQQSCVIGTDANGQCPAGLYLDSLAGLCVPPAGLATVPYGVDNASLALQSYSGCAAGFSYSETFQCCQAVSGGTYPGCAPGSTFNAELGACSPGEIHLAGSGCVTLDVTTLECSQPINTCAPIKNETRCIYNSFCRWNEKDGICEIRK